MEPLDGERVPRPPRAGRHAGGEERVGLDHAGVGEGEAGAAGVGVEDGPLARGEGRVGLPRERREPERARVEVEGPTLVAEPLGERAPRRLPPQRHGPGVIGRVGVAEPGGEVGLGPGLDEHGPAVAPGDRDRAAQPVEVERPAPRRLGPVRERDGRRGEPGEEREGDAQEDEETRHGRAGRGSKLRGRGVRRRGIDEKGRGGPDAAAGRPPRPLFTSAPPSPRPARRARRQRRRRTST